MIPIKLNKFSPRDISIRDDAGHKKRVGFIETFYYDVIFKNSFSIVMLVNILHLGITELIFAGLTIFKNAHFVKRIQLRPPYKSTFLSEKEPLIKINDKQLIGGYINNDTKQWIYHLSIGNRNLGIDLILSKSMVAWKGKTYLGTWLVIPKFNVKGKIFLDRDEVQVVGEGYHDHNIYPIYTPFINRGYHFGKIPIDKFKIIWARVMKNKNNEEYIVVLNKENEYVSIDPKYIEFIIEKQIVDHKKIIPTIWSIHIDYNNLFLNVKMESIKFYHNKLPTINYWRHHIRYSGEMKLNSISKKIDNYEISEFMRFL